MKYQRTPYDCSSAALQAALRCLGLRIGQGRLSKAIGVTEDGADGEDLIRGILSLGLAVDVFESNCKQEARAWLTQYAPQYPVLLCVDDWEHWVTVAGMCGGRMFLFDSTKETWNLAERGTWPKTPCAILKRWKAKRVLRPEGGLYYGLGVTPTKPDCK